MHTTAALTLVLALSLISCAKNTSKTPGTTAADSPVTTSELEAKEVAETNAGMKEVFKEILIGHGGGLLGFYIAELRRLRTPTNIITPCDVPIPLSYSGIDTIGDTATAKYTYNVVTQRNCDDALLAMDVFNTLDGSTRYESPHVKSYDTVETTFANLAKPVEKIDTLYGRQYLRKGYDTLKNDNLSFITTISTFLSHELANGYDDDEVAFDAKTGEIFNVVGAATIDGITSYGRHVHYEPFYWFRPGKKIEIQFPTDPPGTSFFVSY